MVGVNLVVMPCSILTFEIARDGANGGEKNAGDFNRFRGIQPHYRNGAPGKE